MHHAKPWHVVFAGGGTGGHLYPGIALATEMQEKHGAEIMFIGTSYGIENKVLPDLPFEFRRIWMRGLQRTISAGNLIFPFRLAVSVAQCVALFRRWRPVVVIGTGGYVSGPALMAAMFMKIKTVIQEQNSYPGLVNRKLGKYATQVHLTFPESAKYFAGAKEIHESGNPVRSGLRRGDKAAARSKFGLQRAVPTTLVFGGSQGASAINACVAAALPDLLNSTEWQILWITGPHEFESYRQQTETQRQRVSVHAYIDDMASAYAAADLAICRSGASALSEIAVCGLPAILVPYPFAAAGHQEYNAKAVADAGAAIMIPQPDFTPARLLQTLTGLLQDRNRLDEMALKSAALAKPNATADIVTKIISLIKDSNIENET